MFCEKCLEEVRGPFICSKCGTYLLPFKTRFVYEMMKERDVEGLLKALKHEDWEVRWAAAIALGELQDERGVEPLIHALKNVGPPPLRWEIVKALGKIGDARAVEPLTKLCERGDFSHILKAAVKALGKIGDSRATHPLSTLEMKQRAALLGEEVRESTILALGKTGGPEAVDKLIRILQDKNEDEGTRYQAAMALGETGDERAYNALIRAQSDPSRLVRSGAELACGKLLRDIDKAKRY